MLRFISFLGGVLGTLISYQGFLVDDVPKAICGGILVVLQCIINCSSK